MSGDIPRNVWGHSPECLAPFPEMFGDISRNVWRHSPECLRTFPGMFGDIPRNVWGHSLECLATFLGIWHSPHSPRFPHSVPRSCIPGFIHSLHKSVSRIRLQRQRNTHPPLTSSWYRVPLGSERVLPFGTNSRNNVEFTKLIQPVYNKGFWDIRARWLQCHLIPKVKAALLKRGYILVGIGGGVTDDIDKLKTESNLSRRSSCSKRKWEPMCCWRREWYWN